MARIETENYRQQQLDEMQDEIDSLKKELKRKQSKKFFNCGSCFLMILAVCVILVLAGSYVLAKSGLADVPVLSQAIFQEPHPAYLVPNLELSNSDLVNRFQKSIAQATQAGSKTATLKVSDQELTALLRQQTQNNQLLNQQIGYWQLAILPSELELFIQANQPKNLYLTLGFIPKIETGQVKLDVQSIKIGDLQLPKFAGNIWVASAGENTINTMLESVSQIGSLEALSIRDKQLEFKILINKPAN